MQPQMNRNTSYITLCNYYLTKNKQWRSSVCNYPWWFSICWTDGLTFNTWILWYVKKFMVNSMTARCFGWLKNKPPPSWGFVTDIHYLVFAKEHCTSWVNISAVVLPVQRTLLQNPRGLFTYKCANLSHAAVYFLERRGFLLAALPNKSYCSLFLQWCCHEP